MKDFKPEIEVIKFDSEDVIACSGNREFNWTLSDDFKHNPNKDDILEAAERWLKEHGYHAN